MEIPLFPLNVVLFPEGELKLRIFEPRYLDMVSNCLKNDRGFGICLLQEDTSKESSIDFFLMGSYAKIIDWDKMEDGLLGILVKGEKRFKVNSYSRNKDKLCIGNVDWLDEDDARIPDSYQNFSDLLKEIVTRYKLPIGEMKNRYEEANWVSERLAELLPFDLSVKQEILEMNSAIHRFDYMEDLLQKIDANKLI
ncbi:MAG: peptidase S16 [Legionellales bacterium]|nr:peptidase S16 [Legionellales bacterium]|tara:strand:+ start:140 stop:724 length:585 start_codon:yes stop_codon:yes gene_type:complete